MADECVPYYMNADTLTGVGTEAITGKRFVAVDGTVDPGWQPEGLKATATPNVVPVAHTAAVKQFGVAQKTVPSGSLVTCLRTGVVPVTAGAAIVPGVQVEADATGRAITLAAGVPAGLAMSRAGAAGETVAIALYS